MNYQLITAPTKLPITLAELRNELKVDSDNTVDDALMYGLIRTAVDSCENYTRRSLMTQTWTLWLDRFDTRPEPWWDGVRDGSLSELVGHKRYIEIGKSPVQSVTHVKTYDDNDSATTMSSSDYQVDTVSRPARLALRNGKTWPATVLRPLNGIEIQFVAGYGDNESSVPQALRQGMLKLCVHLYENREQVNIGNIVTTIPFGVEALWGQYKVQSL
jgi:hypothetical protein